MGCRPLVIILICVFFPLLAGGDRSTIQTGPIVLIKIDRDSCRDLGGMENSGDLPDSGALQRLDRLYSRFLPVPFG